MTDAIKIVRDIDEDKGTLALCKSISHGEVCHVVGHFWINFQETARTCQLCGCSEKLKVTREWIAQ